MGNPISKMREEAQKQAGEDKKRLEERLQILEKMVVGRLDNELGHILAGERSDQEIHSGTVVELFQQVNIVESIEASQDLKEAVSDFFNGNFLSGLEKLVEVGMDQVLGNASVGEYESNLMFISWTNNALLRHDVYMYRWNFASKGVIENTEGVSAVLTIKRVIDVNKVDPQVISWAISRQAATLGLESQTSQMIDNALAVLRKVVEMQEQVKKMES